MDVKSLFLNRNLNVEVNQDVSNYVTDNYCVLKKDDHVDVSMDATIDINNMEGVNMEDNENLIIVHIYVEDNVLCRMSVKMLEHFVQQIQSNFELRMVGGVTYFPDFQVKQMKDYTFDSQGLYAGSGCTQLLWNNQILKDVTKGGNEDVSQDMPDNMYDMLVIEFPT